MSSRSTWLDLSARSDTAELPGLVNRVVRRAGPSTMRQSLRRIRRQGLTKTGTLERRRSPIGAGTALLCTWLSLGATSALASGSPLSLELSTDGGNFSLTVPVRVSATVTGGTAPFGFAWDHGDGSWSRATGPTESYAYPNIGTFAVTCTVTDSTGASATSKLTLDVSRRPCPSGGECLRNLQIVIYDQCHRVLLPSGYPYRYYLRGGESYWFQTDASTNPKLDFGDGTVVSSSAFTHSYRKDGHYTLTASDDHGIGAVFLDVAPVTSPYPIAVQAWPVPARPLLPVTFGAYSSFGSGIYARTTWDFGDGTAASTTEASIQHAFEEPGTYLTTATLLDSMGASAVGQRSVTVGPPADEARPRLLLPGAVWADGRDGTAWTTDVSFFNPDPKEATTLYLALLEDGQVPTSLVGYPSFTGAIRLEPSSSRTAEDILGNYIGLAKGKSGAIYVLSLGPSKTAPVASLKTRGERPLPSGPVGSVGSWAPAIPYPTSAPSGENLYDLIGLSDDATRQTDLNLANLRAEFTRYEVELFDDRGRKLGHSLSLRLAPYEIHRLGDVAKLAGVDSRQIPLHLFRVRVRVPDQHAGFPWAVVTDRISQDETIVHPQLSPAPWVRVPGIVRSPGRGGAFWSSDLILANPGAASRSLSVVLTFRRNGGPVQTVSKGITLSAGESRVYEDFVAGWLSLAASDVDSYTHGSVEIRPAADDPVPTAPLQARGLVLNRSASGTMGAGIPAFTSLETLSPAGPATRLVLPGLRTDSRYRSNITLFLNDMPPGRSATVVVKILDSSGKVLASLPVGLDAGSDPVQISLGELLEDFVGDTTSLTAVLGERLGDGSVSAFATTVDQLSGDSILIPAAPTP